MCHGVGFALDKDNRFDGGWIGESVGAGVQYIKEEAGAQTAVLLAALPLPSLPVTKRHVYKTYGATNFSYYLDATGGSGTSTFASSTARLLIFATPRYTNDIMDVRFPWVFVRKYISPEPGHGSWGCHSSYKTKVGNARDWAWKIVYSTDAVNTVPSGTPDNWTWRTWEPGSGRKVPQGTAAGWTWGPE
jgi:hypothetical protein